MKIRETNKSNPKKPTCARPCVSIVCLCLTWHKNDSARFEALSCRKTNDCLAFGLCEKVSDLLRRESEEMEKQKKAYVQRHEESLKEI